MKKISKVILAAAAIAALATPAMAADKLIVKNAAGTATVFKVDDAGGITLPINDGTSIGRGASFKNPAAADNFAMVAVTGDGSDANVATAMQMIPKGTGYPGFPIRAQLSVFGTDLIADPNNYEALVLRASGTDYSINATAGGTGLARPITFQMFNAPLVVLTETGNFGIKPAIDGTNIITAMPTHTLEVGNAVAGPGSGTFAIRPVTQTTAVAAGGAAALPATPAGYFTITINGVDRKVAYY